MDMELAAIIAEMEADDNTAKEEIVIATETIDENTEEIVPVEEVIEDDVLVEDRPPVELPTFKTGDAVMLKPNAKFISGTIIPNNLFNTKLYIRQVKDNGYAVAPKTIGRISGIVDAENLALYTEHSVNTTNEFTPYYALIAAETLNIKSRPVDNSSTLKVIYRGSIFTIVDEKNGWGHLKIGGWIPLNSVRKIGE